MSTPDELVLANAASNEIDDPSRQITNTFSDISPTATLSKKKKSLKIAKRKKTTNKVLTGDGEDAHKILIKLPTGGKQMDEPFI